MPDETGASPERNARLIARVVDQAQIDGGRPFRKDRKIHTPPIPCCPQWIRITRLLVHFAASIGWRWTLTPSDAARTRTTADQKGLPPEKALTLPPVPNEPLAGAEHPTPNASLPALPLPPVPKTLALPAALLNAPPPSSGAVPGLAPPVF